MEFSYLAFFTWIHFVLDANVKLADRQNVFDFLECWILDAQFLLQLPPLLSGLFTIDVSRIHADPSKMMIALVESRKLTKSVEGFQCVTFRDHCGACLA